MGGKYLRSTCILLPQGRKTWYLILPFLFYSQNFIFQRASLQARPPHPKLIAPPKVIVVANIYCVYSAPGIVLSSSCVLIYLSLTAALIRVLLLPPFYGWGNWDRGMLSGPVHFPWAGWLQVSEALPFWRARCIPGVPEAPRCSLSLALEEPVLPCEWGPTAGPETAQLTEIGTCSLVCSLLILWLLLVLTCLFWAPGTWQGRS